MTPQLNVEAEGPPASEEPVERPQASPRTERRLLALSWTGITLGAFVLLCGIALGAAIVFNAGFGGWLLTVAVMGLTVALIALVVDYLVHRPAR